MAPGRLKDGEIWKSQCGRRPRNLRRRHSLPPILAGEVAPLPTSATSRNPLSRFTPPNSMLTIVPLEGGAGARLGAGVGAALLTLVPAELTALVLGTERGAGKSGIFGIKWPQASHASIPNPADPTSMVRRRRIAFSPAGGGVARSAAGAGAARSVAGAGAVETAEAKLLIGNAVESVKPIHSATARALCG